MAALVTDKVCSMAELFNNLFCNYKEVVSNLTSVTLAREKLKSDLKYSHSSLIENCESSKFAFSAMAIFPMSQNTRRLLIVD